MSARTEMLDMLLRDLEEADLNDEFDEYSAEYIYVQSMSDLEYDVMITNPINLIMELV